MQYVPPLRISRRQALVGGAATAVSVALGSRAASAGPTGDADAIVVGHGLAGLAAAAELAERGRRVILLDQEPEQNLGGQAFWSLGGLFLVNSLEQRLCGVADSPQLAREDWFNTAGFDRGPEQVGGEDYWGKRWAEAYLDFASGEKRAWLASLGMLWVPVVGWAERGLPNGAGPGNSVPRFHITLGTGPGVVEPFERRVRCAAEAGSITFRFRHRVDNLLVTNGKVVGVSGDILENSSAPRGTPSSRTVVGDFELHAAAVIVTSGGIGGNQDTVRQNWPSRLGAPPARMITGVPAYVDGKMIDVAEQTGVRIVNRDRMWHYTEGLTNHSPIWPGHGIRVLGAPSSMWFDGAGRRFADPGIPSVDTLGTLELIQRSGYDYSWFVLNKRIIDKEFVLSGSEQNPELTSKNLVAYLADRVVRDTPAPIQAFLDRGFDFVTADNVRTLASRMNNLTQTTLIDPIFLENQIIARDREIRNRNTTDTQILTIKKSLAYAGDSLVRTSELAPILDPSAGPLIAIRMNILTRKTLGGIQTDLQGRVLSVSGSPIPGLYSAGEAAGFGGGGVHGYRSLEGTFLGGCIFSGRQAGRSAAAEIA